MQEERKIKPGAYTQLYTHLVFAVKYRERLLRKEIRPEVFSYISGIITKRKHKSIIVNGVSDHIHILFGLNPNDKISDLVATIKRSSSIYINQQNWLRGKFCWQDGYGAFSYSRSGLENVYRYIENQENHHKERSFRQEYITQLKQFKIEYDKKYLFEFFE
jgi:REP element-mobilizing transposase RayT